jgi:hypothetical protein
VNKKRLYVVKEKTGGTGKSKSERKIGREGKHK